jgi:RecB family exonuclease
MLKVSPLTSGSESQKFLSATDFTKTTWLVSDLRTKLELQKYIIQKHGYFENSMVLRASEFWSLLLRRAYPNYKILSVPYIKAFIRNHCDRPGAEEILFPLMNEFSSVFCHETGIELLQEWLQEYPSAKARLADWLDIAHQLFSTLLEKRQLSPRWVAPWLSNQEIDFRKVWQQSLVADLGAEILRSEAELLSQIAKTCDLQILEPVTLLESRFFYVKKPFQILRESKPFTDLSWAQASAKDVEKNVFRYASPVAEVQHAAHWARAWIEAGIAPEKILISAPQIESYWPLIEPLFRIEGLPVSKDLCASLESLPDLQRWFARMRVALKNFEFSDLQTSLYSPQNMPTDRFESFQALFSRILDAEDLQRDKKIRQAFEDPQFPEGPLTVHEYLGKALRYWPLDANVDSLQGPLKKLLEENLESLPLTFKNWTYLIEQLTNKMEMPILRGQQSGVRIENLASAPGHLFTHRIYLGLVENAFRKQETHMFTPSETEHLDLDTGFQLNHPEQSSLLYDLYFQAQSGSTTDHFLYALADVQGAVQTPHAFCVELEETKGLQAQIQIPPPGVFDHQLANSSVYEEVLQSEALLPNSPRALSASGVENYWKCPFRFLAAQIFRLQDLADLDMDPDPRSSGTFAHWLFRELATEPRRFDWTDETVGHLVDKIFEEHFPKQQQLWQPFRERWVRLGKKFIQFESESILPLIKSTRGTEIEFKAEIHGRSWKGTIDRVDELKDGSLRVLDYKASEKSYSIKSWQKNQHFQLAFYSWLLKKGLINGFPAGQELSASYYVYKNFRLHPTDSGAESREYLEQHIQWAEGEVSNFVEKLNSGLYPAKPKEVKTCESCNWRTLCRAPHLDA